jgi:hypothetical protein
MKLFILAPPASGKTTVSVHLRTVSDIRVMDSDDEILRLNHNIWPDIKTKNEVFLPKVVEAATKLDNVILLNSYMPIELADKLKEVGFTFVLLDVSGEELRRRHQARLAEEGWSNEEWFDWHQNVIQELRDKGFIDHIVSGEQAPGEVARQIARIGENRVTTYVNGPKQQ